MRTLIALIIFCVFVSVSPANAQDQPVIAPEIGQLIAEEGIDAAKVRFKELAQSDSLNLNIEVQGMHTLLGAYMQAGNNEAAEAVGAMTAELTMSMLSGGMGNGMGMDMEAMQQAEMTAREQEEKNREEERKQAQKQLEQSRGKSRDDLNRFAGLYGELENDDMGKTIFVIVSCDGYLVAGPMWADVGSWWMRSAASSVFTYSDSWTSFSMEFKQDGQNGTYQIDHEIEGIGTPLEWKGQLPEDFGECVERPTR